MFKIPSLIFLFMHFKIFILKIRVAEKKRVVQIHAPSDCHTQSLVMTNPGIRSLISVSGSGQWPKLSDHLLLQSQASSRVLV